MPITIAINNIEMQAIKGANTSIVIRNPFTNLLGASLYEYKQNNRGKVESLFIKPYFPQNSLQFSPLPFPDSQFQKVTFFPTHKTRDLIKEYCSSSQHE